MMESPHPLEQSLGMHYYGTDTPGIGGVLKRVPGDFVVEEIPAPPAGDGPYLLVRLTKENWDLQHAVREIANRLGISHRRIGWAGTKDKRAVTTQVISIYDADPEDVERVRIRDISLTVIGCAAHPVALGMLAGNRFAIAIRECETRDLPERVGEVAASVPAGIPNYVGIQRFGAIRPITHRVGEFILRQDYAGAVLAYVGEAFPHEPQEIQAARRDYSRTLDARTALQAFPVHLSYERSMLHHLDAHPADYAGALRQLPPKLLSMFVSAFQSYLFNLALTRRLSRGISLSTPVPGDTLLFPDGRGDAVTDQNRLAAALQVRRGRARIAIFIPGSKGGEGRSPCPIMRELLDLHGITAEDFASAQKFVKAAFEGASRPIALATRLDARVDGDTVHLAFTLEPGQYATTVCREFMKSDPLTMV